MHRLRLLLELKHRGTLGAVAKALNYSASTISQQLSQLEAEVGVELLEPVGRRVRLTSQADTLVAHAEIMLRQMEAAETAVAQSLAEITGTVRIATFQTALTLVSRALVRIEEAHPRLRVEVLQEEPQRALPRLLAHDLDLVVVEEFPHHPLPRRSDIHYQELLRDRLRIALPAGTPSASDVWQCLAGRTWAVEPLGTASRDWMRMICREAGHEPDIRFTTTDLLMQRQLVADGHAVAILPDLLGPADDPGLTLVDIPGGPCYRDVHTATRQDRAAHPAITAVRSALTDACARQAAPSASGGCGPFGSGTLSGP
ncbi:LysR family transcriptional regulator [Streptomyces sp. Ac-502]|uniref:LysR family transcriptional regulator n=1 Tax=Streptomyces sp. Ac-502 TaxID=3342801 RepID=UPI003862B1C9